MTPAFFRCRCGHEFPEELGAYGCPNCCGDRGAAKLVVPQPGNLLVEDADNPA